MNYTDVHTTFTDGIVGKYYEILKKNFYEKIDVQKHAQTYIAPKEDKCAEPEFTGKFIDVCMHYANSDKNDAAVAKAKVVIDSILKNQRADGVHLVDYASAGRRNNSEYSVWIVRK